MLQKRISLILVLVMCVSILPAFDAHAIENSSIYESEDELHEPVIMTEPSKEELHEPSIMIEPSDDELYEPATMVVPLNAAIRPPAIRTREEIVKQFLDFPYNTTSIDTFSSEPRFTLPLSAGVVSDASMQNGLNSVNFVRFVAGLPHVTLNTEFTNQAQHASILLAYIGEGLTHYPSQPSGVNKEFFDLAYQGASRSNLGVGYGSLASSVIHGWMTSTSGHRQWVLHPPLRQIGLGIAHNPSSYSAMHVLDNTFGTQPFDYVAWPAEVMPHHLYLQNRTFSITLFGYNAINANTISINITSQKLGNTWTVTGQQLIFGSVFRENSVSFNTPVTFDADDVLTITVSGISKGGVATSISYKTEFFNMHPDKISDLSATPGNRFVTLSWTVPDSSASAITRYEYRSRVVREWSWGDWTSLPGLGTSHTVTGLTNGATYDFQVRAVNAVGVAEDASVTARLYDNIEQFVERLYRNVHNRNSDPSGLAFWSAQLRNQTNTGANVAYGFFFSSEMRNRNHPNEVFVEILYTTLMDRPSDPGGRNFWVNQLNNGASRESVFAGFVNSAEFNRICNDYGIIRSTYTPPGNQPTPPPPQPTPQPPSQPVNEALVRDFVTRLYAETLGRQADQGGLNFWTTQLMNGRSGTSVAYEFFFSPEMRNRNHSDEVFVEILYITLMDRASDPGGKNFWISQLNNGASRETVFARFADSNEFNRICNDYGINR